MKRLVLVAALSLFAATAANAQTSGDITVQSAWARATPPGADTGALYLTLTNKGAADDRLTGVDTPVADMAMLHVDRMENGVMKMRELKSVDIAPGKSAVLKPGGMHVMLMGLKHPLKRGDRFSVTLTFAHAPPLTAQVEVAKIGAAAPDMAHMRHVDEMGGTPH